MIGHLVAALLAANWIAGPPPADCPTTGVVILRVLPVKDAAAMCAILSGIPNATACYEPRSNIIILPDPSEMSDKATRQILRHELCHANGGTH